MLPTRVRAETQERPARMRTKARCQAPLQKLQIKTRKKLFTHPSFLIAPLKNILAIKPIIGKKEKKMLHIKLNWSFHNADLVVKEIRHWRKDKPAIPLDLCSVLAFHMCSFCCRRVLIALLCITILVQIRRRRREGKKRNEIGPR